MHLTYIKSLKCAVWKTKFVWATVYNNLKLIKDLCKNSSELLFSSNFFNLIIQKVTSPIWLKLNKRNNTNKILISQWTKPWVLSNPNQ